MLLQVNFGDYVVNNISMRKRTVEQLLKLVRVLPSTANIVLVAGIRLWSTVETDLEAMREFLPWMRSQSIDRVKVVQRRCNETQGYTGRLDGAFRKTFTDVLRAEQAKDFFAYLCYHSRQLKEMAFRCSDEKNKDEKSKKEEASESKD